MTTALATQTPFTPTGIEQATQLATTLAKSTLIPDHLRNKPADILVTIITGHELGLSPMQALRGMHVINGKASMSADLMVALVLKHRDVCEYFRLVESTDTVAAYETRRHGSEPVKLAWTMAQANAAGLSGSPTWKKHPAAMLRARCAAALARAVYPDLVLGVYDPDETAEFTPPAKVLPYVQPEAPAPAPVVEVLPAPGPLDPGIDPPAMEAEVVEEPLATETDKVIKAIRAAQTRGALLVLVPRIKGLPSEDIAVVRAEYAKRQGEINP